MPRRARARVDRRAGQELAHRLRSAAQPGSGDRSRNPCRGAAGLKLTATAAGPINGEAAIPGDKSCSHRALILGAMAEGETRIVGLLESDDVLATARAVEALGAAVKRNAPGDWTIQGGPWHS